MNFNAVASNYFDRLHELFLCICVSYCPFAYIFPYFIILKYSISLSLVLTAGFVAYGFKGLPFVIFKIFFPLIPLIPFVICLIRIVKIDKKISLGHPYRINKYSQGLFLGLIMSVIC